MQQDDEAKEIIDVVVGRDSNFADHLLYLNKTDDMLSAQKLPSLEQKFNIVEKQATALALFDNQRMAVIGDETGDFTFIWNPYDIDSSQNKPLLILY